MAEQVFVAREQELSLLQAFLESALAGQGQVVFVTGEAGSGKTALVTEFARCAQDAHPDLLVAIGNCNAQTGIGDPYLPFREVLSMLTGDVEAKLRRGDIGAEHAGQLRDFLHVSGQALVDLGPDLIDIFVPGVGLATRAGALLAGKVGWLDRLEELTERKAARAGQDTGLEQSRIFEQYTNVLIALAGQQPLMLVVDDLQWADVSSINLMFHLGRRIGESHLLMVGSYRPDDVALGRAGERHPLEPVVNELKRYYGDVWVDLGRAARAEGRGFVDALLDAEPNRLGEAFREALFRQTEGHPLFTIELLRNLQAWGNLLQDEEGRWVKGPALDWGAVPVRVEGVIEERIGRLEAELREALTVASVEGEDFTAQVIARVQEVSERQLVRRLTQELDRQHRLVWERGIERVGGQRLSLYRFRHNLFQRYLYNNLGQTEREFLHEDVGRVLEKLYGDQTEEIAVQLARHFQEAGITEKAIHYLRQAGDRALQLSAYREGTAHLTRGLALLMTLPDSLERAQQELALQLSLGVAYMVSDRAIPEMRNAYTRARELCRQTGKTSQLCQILGQLATTRYVRAEYQKARELAQEALSLAQQAEDPLLVALCRWRLGYVSFGLGEYEAARTHFERMIAFYEPQYHHPLVVLSGSDPGLSARAYDACCLWCLGYPEQALKRSQEALALGRELDHPFSLAELLCFAGCVFNDLRRDAQALKGNAEELLRLGNEMRMTTWLGMATWFRGEALVMLGNVQEGMAQIREGMAACQSTDVRLYLPRALHSLAEAQAKAGHPEEGLTTLAEALAMVEQTDERHWEAELHRLRAELLLMQGDETEAEASLHKAIEVARQQSAKSWELRAAVSLCQLWQNQGNVQEARQMLAEIYDWFTEGFDTPDLTKAKALLEELS